MAKLRDNGLGLVTEVTDAEYKEQLELAKLRMLDEEAYLRLLLRDGLEEEAEVAESEESLRHYAKFIWPVIEAGQPMTTGYATDAICDHLQAVSEGHIKKLAIFVPPGFAKSHLTCVIWPTWEWGPRRNAHLRYITASYSEDLTLGTNQLSRALIESDIYKKWWRKDWTINPKQDNKTEFANSKRGFRFATSTGGTVTGKRGHRNIFDDLHSADDAESDAKRDGQVRWMRESASNRVVDQHATFTLIMQRLHSKDAGGVAEELGWTILCLPMRYESEHPNVWVGGPLHKETATGRKYLAQWGAGDWRKTEGELAFPERFPEEMVVEQEENMGEYAVAGQNQQRPAPRGGGMFKVDKIEYVQLWNVPDGLAASRGWDFAGTKGKRSAYTASAKLAIDHASGFIYVLDAQMARLSPDELEAALVKVAEADGPNVRQSMPQDPAQAGVFQAHVLAKLLGGHDFDFSLETGDKVKRAGPFAAQVNAGMVRVVVMPWNTQLKTQLETFPNGKSKDLVDALSRAYMDAVMRKRVEHGVPVAPKTFDTQWKVASPYRVR